MMKVGPVYNFEAHLDKIIDFSRKRKMLKLLEVGKNSVHHAGTSIDDVVTNIENGMMEVNKNQFCEAASIKEISESINLDGEKYLKTGLPELDDILLGLFGGQLIVIGSRPGIGKSAIVLQIAKYMSLDEKILLFSLEMPKAQILRRMITTETGISANRIRSGQTSQEEKTQIKDCMNYLSHKYENLIIVDSENKFWNIANNIRRFYYSSGIKAVIIDYLQLCQIKSKEQRYLQLGEMTSTLKNLSVRFDIPIIILSQLSRASQDEIPKLSDLRESGNIEQDTDVVIFLHRKDTKENKTDIIVAKDRDGDLGYKKIFFNFSRVRFETYEDELYDVTTETI
jgi:replicative DNA helicase